ncbi:MAG: type 4a pilus biogenesis protein PilO [Candidatus Omnitrophota bacterium]
MINIPLDFGKNKKQTMIFGSLVLVFVIVAYFYLLIGPQVTRLTESLSAMGKMMADINTAEALIKKKALFVKNIEEYKGKVDFYEKRLPAQQEIPSLLENLSRIAQEANVKILGITPLSASLKDQQAQKDKIYNEIPILISAKSGYHELGVFLSDLENADRFMKVVDIEIKANKVTPKRHDVELIVCTYTLVGEKKNR